MQKEMELFLAESQIKHIARQLADWSRAGTQAIDREDRYGWEMSIKSIKSMTFTLTHVSYELLNEVQQRVQEQLIKELGSEEAFEANNAKWSEWQNKLRKERQEGK